MSNYPRHPRVLFVTPEVVFMPEKKDNRSNFICINAGDIGNFPIKLIIDLFHLGVDIYVAQPDYRMIFEVLARNEQSHSRVKLPIDRLQLAEDRVFYYSKLINSNSELENIKLSLVFQREVINQIIPRIQPELIHCYGWMTGLIPAAAKKNEIPCLYTVQKLETARSILSYVEDIGIDAAEFWQNLFYDRYPGNYEETRSSNQLDLLLSGILSANLVNTEKTLATLNIDKCPRDDLSSPVRQLLGEKAKAGCTCEMTSIPDNGIDPARNQKTYGRDRSRHHNAAQQKNGRSNKKNLSSSDGRQPAEYYIDLYKMILHRRQVS